MVSSQARCGRDGNNATYADLAEAHIPALRTEVLHPVERQLAQVPRVLAPTCDERKGDVSVPKSDGVCAGTIDRGDLLAPLHSENACPRRY